MFVVTSFMHYIANLQHVYALSFWYMYVWLLIWHPNHKGDVRHACSVQLDLHFCFFCFFVCVFFVFFVCFFCLCVFFFVIMFCFAISRSLACCLPSRAKKEIQSCIVFRRTQCPNTVCSGYKVQGGRIRNHRGWKTTKTWWLLSGELMAITVSILSLYIIF